MNRIYSFGFIALFIVLSFGLTAQNNSLLFDGTDDYVNCGTGLDISDNTLTIEAWIYPTDFKSSSYVNTIAGNDYWDAGTSKGYVFRYGDTTGDLDFTFAYAGGYNWASTTATSVLKLNEWQHVAAVYDGSNVHIYVNGKERKSSAYNYNIVSSSHDFWIGNTSSDPTNRQMVGKIDEVRVWSNARTEAEIRQNMFTELSGSETNLMASYNFNETSGTNLSDATGNNNGTLTNMTGNEWQPSAAFFGPKSCLDFDGTDDIASVSGLSFTSASSITIEGWIYPRTFNPSSPDANISNVAGYPNASALVRIGDAMIANNQLQFILFGTDRLNSNTYLSANKWYHFAAVYDGTTMSLYINGILDNTHSVTNTLTSTGSFTFGQDGTDGRCLDGQMDEVRVWSDARTQSEIIENMHKTLQGNEDGLLAYYNFDNASGTTLQDLSGNSYDATLTNMDNSDWVASTAFNIWLNTNSTSWATAENWSSGSVPGSDDNVGVYNLNSENPTLSDERSLANLIVGTDATLTISGDLGVNNNLILPGTISATGSVTHFGTLLNLNSISGSATIYDNGNLINDGSITANTINVGSEKTLSINSGAKMTVNSNVSNSGTFSILADATGSGSLIVNGTSSGNFACQSYFPNGAKWHIIGAPVEGQNKYGFALDFNNDISQKTDIYENVTGAVAGYLENINDWNTAYTTSYGDGDFISGTGYCARRNTAGTVSYNGTLKTGNLSGITLSRTNAGTGWNLLANPYTSAVNATATADPDNNLLTVNAASMDQSYAALYLWDATANSGNGAYVTINNAGTGTLVQNYIQAGQGFFVRSKTGGGTFDFTSAMQTHQSSLALKSGESVWPVIRVITESPKKSSSTLIAFNDNMTNGLDVTYDAGMFKSDKEFALYTRLVEDNGVDFAVQAIPENRIDDQVIPLGLDVPAGTEISFHAELQNLPTGSEIVLEDRWAGKFTKLGNDNEIYKVVVTENMKGVGNFFLHTKSGLTSVNEINGEDFRITINYAERCIMISTNETLPTVAKVYDLAGRVIGEMQLQKETISKMTLNGNSQGVYVVQLLNPNRTFSKKIVWR